MHGVAPCSAIGSQLTPTPRRAQIASASARSAAIARSRVASSWWRMSSVASTRPGMTLQAPCGMPISPTVATSPGSSLAARSAASTNSAAAPSASRRRRIGVVPAWPAWPSKARLKRLWPAIAVTTPSGRPAASSTGPCSMWTSKYARMSSGTSAGPGSVAPIASPSVTPAGSRSASSSGASRPTNARLPRNVLWNRSPSSSANATTSSASGSAPTPRRRRARRARRGCRRSGRRRRRSRGASR